MQFFLVLHKALIQSCRCRTKGRNSRYDPCLISLFPNSLVNIHTGRVHGGISQRDKHHIHSFFQKLCCFFCTLVMYLTKPFFFFHHRHWQIQLGFLPDLCICLHCNLIGNTFFQITFICRICSCRIIRRLCKIFIRYRDCNHRTLLHDTQCLYCQKLGISRPYTCSVKYSAHSFSPVRFSFTDSARMISKSSSAPEVSPNIPFSFENTIASTRRDSPPLCFR